MATSLRQERRSKRAKEESACMSVTCSRIAEREEGGERERNEKTPSAGLKRLKKANEKRGIQKKRE